MSRDSKSHLSELTKGSLYLLGDFIRIVYPSVRFNSRKSRRKLVDTISVDSSDMDFLDCNALPLIQKPYTPDDLFRAVPAALDG